MAEEQGKMRCDSRSGSKSSVTSLVSTDVGGSRSGSKSSVTSLVSTDVGSEFTRQHSDWSGCPEEGFLDGEHKLDESFPDEEVVCLFDWDDTLLPSWYLKRVVEPCLASSREAAEAPLLPASSFYEPLRSHAKLVEDTLRTARTFGPVAIVTLSQRGWVTDSAQRFLPGLDVPQLLADLDIEVYYAAEHVHSSLARTMSSPPAAKALWEEGVNVPVRCKHAAMEKCLRQMCKRRHLRLNVISVGDSEAEQHALQDLLWSSRRAGLPREDHLCKTVKMLDEPTLEELSCQLKSLLAWLPELVAHAADFELDWAAEE